MGLIFRNMSLKQLERDLTSYYINFILVPQLEQN